MGEKRTSWRHSGDGNAAPCGSDAPLQIIVALVTGQRVDPTTAVEGVVALLFGATTSSRSADLYNQRYKQQRRKADQRDPPSRGATLDFTATPHPREANAAQITRRPERPRVRRFRT